MAISDEIQFVVIELDTIDKVMELFWMAFQQPTVTMEHAISSMCLLRKQVNEIEQHIQKILEAIEKEETERELKYEP